MLGQFKNHNLLLSVLVDKELYIVRSLHYVHFNQIFLT